MRAMSLPVVGIGLTIARVVMIGLAAIALSAMSLPDQKALTKTQPPAQPYVQTGEEVQTRRRAFVHPYIETWYDARANRTLATCSAGLVTEQDLLLYRMMKREANPAVFQTWAKSRSAAERGRATRTLEEAIRRYVCLLYTSDAADE